MQSILFIQIGNDKLTLANQKYSSKLIPYLSKGYFCGVFLRLSGLSWRKESSWNFEYTRCLLNRNGSI